MLATCGKRCTASTLKIEGYVVCFQPPDLLTPGTFTSGSLAVRTSRQQSSLALLVTRLPLLAPHAFLTNGRSVALHQTPMAHIAWASRWVFVWSMLSH